MTINSQLERAHAPAREDARDLIARLCHELGVSAVADALGNRDLVDPAETQVAAAPRLDVAA